MALRSLAHLRVGILGPSAAHSIIATPAAAGSSSSSSSAAAASVVGLRGVATTGSGAAATGSGAKG